MATQKITQDQYTSLAQDQFGIMLTGYTGPTLTPKTVTQLEFKTDTTFKPVGYNLYIRADGGTSMNLAFSTNTYGKSYTAKAGENWQFEDDQDPMIAVPAGPVDWTPLVPATPIPGVFFGGKKVKSMSIDGKNVWSLTIDGKIFNFPTTVGLKNFIRNDEYDQISVSSDSFKNTIKITGYTGIMTKADLTSGAYIQFTDQVTIAQSSLIEVDVTKKDGTKFDNSFYSNQTSQSYPNNNVVYLFDYVQTHPTYVAQSDYITIDNSANSYELKVTGYTGSYDNSSSLEPILIDFKSKVTFSSTADRKILVSMDAGPSTGGLPFNATYSVSSANGSWTAEAGEVWFITAGTDPVKVE